MKAELDYFLCSETQPPNGEVKLVFAWTNLLRGFYTFAIYQDGKWIENNAGKQDITDDVEFWFEMPKIGTLDA